jgi:DNA-binding MarR family transcriptional regulator
VSSEVDRLSDGIVALWRAIAPPSSELTTPQAIALSTVARQGPLRMSELAAELRVTVATASRTVDSLAGLGYATRERDPEDSRAVRVSATASGRRLLKQRRDRFRRRLDGLLVELSVSERRQLADAVEKLAEILSRHERRAG